MKIQKDPCLKKVSGKVKFENKLSIVDQIQNG